MKPESEEIESERFHLIFDCSHDSDVYDQMKIKLSKSHAEAEEPANHNTSSQDIRGFFSFHKSLATELQAAWVLFFRFHTFDFHLNMSLFASENEPLTWV